MCAHVPAFPNTMYRLVRAGLRNPTRVVVKVEAGRNEGFQRTPASLSISYLITPASGKLAHLMNLVAANPGKKFIVYLATCASVDYFYRILKRVPLLRATTSAFSLSSLHGKMDPKRREAVYETFANASAAILLCTDMYVPRTHTELTMQRCAWPRYPGCGLGRAIRPAARPRAIHTPVRPHGALKPSRARACSPYPARGHLH